MIWISLLIFFQKFRFFLFSLGATRWPFLLILDTSSDLTFNTPSIYIAQNMTGNPFHFATRQALFIGIGIFIFTIFLLVPSTLLENEVVNEIYK